MTAQVSSHEVSCRKNVLLRPQRLVALRDRLVAMLLEWRRRSASRRELAQLSDFDLKDIGYPAQAEAEKAKPFWRA